MLEKDEGWVWGGGFCVCMYLVTRCGQEPCQVGALFRFGLCFGVSIKLLCFHGVNKFFPSSKIQFWQFWDHHQRVSNDFISYFTAVSQFGFSLPPWTTPDNNPQKSSCFLVGSDTNQPPSVFRWISLAFREFFGFNAFRLHSTKMSKQKGQHRHRNFISIRNRKHRPSSRCMGNLNVSMLGEFPDHLEKSGHLCFSCRVHGIFHYKKPLPFWGNLTIQGVGMLESQNYNPQPLKCFLLVDELSRWVYSNRLSPIKKQGPKWGFYLDKASLSPAGLGLDICLDTELYMYYLGKKQSI